MFAETSVSFLDLCVRGETKPGDVDDFVNAWHAGAGGASLGEFLGLSQSEYDRWIQEPDSLRDILHSRTGAASIASH
jgi:hypothetical protein